MVFVVSRRSLSPEGEQRQGQAKKAHAFIVSLFLEVVVASLSDSGD